MANTKRVDELVIGDMVDLQGDTFADNGDHPEFEFEYQPVAEIERETAACICVYFDNCAFGFPPSHVVTLAD